MSGIFSIIAPNVMHEIKGCCLYEDSFWLVLCSQKLSIALVLTGHRVPLSCQLMALLTASAGSSADCITWLISWLRSTTLLADMTPGIALTVLTTHHCKPLYPPPPQLHHIMCQCLLSLMLTLLCIPCGGIFFAALPACRLRAGRYQKRALPPNVTCCKYKSILAKVVLTELWMLNQACCWCPSLTISCNCSHIWMG